MTSARFVLSALLVVVLPLPALAWNRAGHMVTAAIAYHRLKQTDPAALANAINLLKKHPDYAGRWLGQINQFKHEGDDEINMHLFMLAARWPDDIRKTKHDRPTEHYIDYAFI